MKVRVKVRGRVGVRVRIRLKRRHLRRERLLGRTISGPLGKRVEPQRVGRERDEVALARAGRLAGQLGAHHATAQLGGLGDCISVEDSALALAAVVGEGPRAEQRDCPLDEGELAAARGQVQWRAPQHVELPAAPAHRHPQPRSLRRLAQGLSRLLFGRQLGRQPGAPLLERRGVHGHEELRCDAHRAARRRRVRERRALAGPVLPHDEQLGEALHGLHVSSG